MNTYEYKWDDAALIAGANQSCQTGGGHREASVCDSERSGADPTS